MPWPIGPCRSPDGQPWTTVPFEHVTSGGSDWWCAKLTGANFPHDATPLLEFVVRGDGDAWDKAASGSNYALSSPGRYRLWGSLGTGSPGGSLVDEQGCVTESHGARARGSRIDLDPEFWTLDATYERTLDAGWHLQSVYDATYALRASLPKDALHFRPAGEQNAHKVTLGILAEHAKRAARNLGEELGTRGLACRCVVSGEGEWRFLDVLPRGAGKLAALRRAQRLLGFGDARTVAGGDSGNDADVLCGPHRGIVVGNAQRGLLDELERGAGSEQVCFAEKGFAWGLLQGLRAMSFIEA
ncbi:hypothetical protein H632_c310p2 [Helicosporidium sp. ATCC 50920]|nr:hypothetical protein H632_c310p2 [Helicosporidium sp. ATCC 50920]|eukprot:KDD76220.1 hypothetical protein H632_c310p2 [Helicosporidium sp. ATCC 50920]